MALLKFLVIGFLITLFTPYCLACSIAPVLANVPQNQQETYKKTLLEYGDRIRSSDKRQLLKTLYRDSEHIYIGKVEQLLIGKESTKAGEASEKSWAYIKVSRGWKKGKSKYFSLVYEPRNYIIPCSTSLYYKLEQGRTYLFYENLNKIVTAIPKYSGTVIKHSNNNSDNPKFLVNTQHLGASEWYYARSNQIKYNNLDNHLHMK